MTNYHTESRGGFVISQPDVRTALMRVRHWEDSVRITAHGPDGDVRMILTATEAREFAKAILAAADKAEKEIDSIPPAPAT